MKRDLHGWNAGNTQLIHAELVLYSSVCYLALIAFLQST